MHLKYTSEWREDRQLLRRESAPPPPPAPWVTPSDLAAQRDFYSPTSSLSAGRPPFGPPGLLRRRGRSRPGSARPATAGRRRARSRCSSRWRRWRLRRQKIRRTALRRLSSFVFCRISHTRALREVRAFRDSNPQPKAARSNRGRLCHRGRSCRALQKTGASYAASLRMLPASLAVRCTTRKC